MDSIVNRLTEIEDAASAIVQHADEQARETVSCRHESDEQRGGSCVDADELGVG